MRSLDEAAELTYQNRGLAWTYALQRHNRHDFRDSVQDAMVGLLEACARHDPKRAALSTCAWQWMRVRVNEGFRKRRMVIVPAHIWDAAGADRRTDGFVSAEESPHLADRTVRPEQEKASARLDVQRLISHLKGRDRAIIVARYGLDGGPPLSLKATGQLFGLCRERVRQIELEILESLRLRAA